VSTKFDSYYRLERKYSDDQERDENGRFAGGGVSDAKFAQSSAAREAYAQDVAELPGLITSNERSALDAFTGIDHDAIQAINSGTTREKFNSSQARQVSETRWAELQTNASDLHGFVSGEARVHEQVFRGTTLSTAQLASLKPGSEVSFPVTTSASSSITVAHEFSSMGKGQPVVYQIVGAKGTYVAGMSKAKGEHEVILPKGQKFSVVSIGKLTGGSVDDAVLVKVRAVNKTTSTRIPKGRK
jgi:Ca2+-binding RTX toxin-like protein